MSSGKNANRKRKRVDAGGIDYPEIPGVPMDVIPIFINAIKISSKFFGKETSEAFGVATNPRNRNNDPSSQNNNNDSSASVLGTWMDRMQAATDASDQEKKNERNQRRLKMEEAIDQWLESVKRFVMYKPRNNNRPNEQSNAEDPTKPSGPSRAGDDTQKISVPYACFLYLWDLQQEHSRIAVRRSALYMSSLLLQKSKDCRFHLEQDTNLVTWMTNIVADGVTWKNPELTTEQLPLLHQEASMLLDQLVDGGYSNLYPKIGVAAQRIRQTCPNVKSMHLTSTTTRSMADWRKLRDIALVHGKRELKRVESLIKKSNVCLEILVPRLGQEEPAPRSAVVADTGLPQDATDDGDEEDGIAWEDGDENDFEDGSSFMAPDIHHLSAVEQTLAAMESAGGLRCGELEIDFNNPHTSTDEIMSPSEKGASPGVSQTTTKFKKLVTSLARRHMPRVNMWLEGLTNADNLVLVEESSSLVTLSSENIQWRRGLLEQLSHSKRAISSVLASANKLSIQTTAASATASANTAGDTEDGTTTLTSDPLPARVEPPRLCSETTNQRALSMRIQQYRKKKNYQQRRSHKIQIKYRSS